MHADNLLSIGIYTSIKWRMESDYRVVRMKCLAGLFRINQLIMARCRCHPPGPHPLYMLRAASVAGVSAGGVS